MRFLRFGLLLVAACLLAGCLISEQEGEKGHVNSRDPDRVAFHFDSGMNCGLVWRRSAALVLLDIWCAGLAEGSKKAFAIGPGTLPCVAVATWLLLQGLGQIGGYRIDVEPDRVTVQAPGADTREFLWEDIEGLHVEGTAYELNTGVKTFEEYDSMELHLVGGECHFVDLRPLSVEQRDTLWQAIVKRAQMVANPG